MGKFEIEDMRWKYICAIQAFNVTEVDDGYYEWVVHQYALPA